MAFKLFININSKLVVGEGPYGLIKSLCVDYVLTLALDGYGVEHRSDTLIHIIGRYLNIAVYSLDENALDRGDCILVGNSSHSGSKLIH